jgi:hypothetical protein
VDAVGVADEDVGPAARPPQRALGDREVVADDLDLRDPRLGKVDLARVRDRDLPAGGLDHDLLRLARRHRRRG